MTSAEFQQNTEKREKLAKMLKDPVLKEAIECLSDEVDPRSDLPVSLANPTVAAHRFHQFAGMNHFTKGLKRLSTLPAPAPKPLRQKTLRPEKQDHATS